MKDAIKHIEANNPRVRKIMDILGLPDESYQEVKIHIKTGDVVRAEAKFIAKG